MTRYTFNIDQASQHYIRIEAQFDVKNDLTEIQLPSWRPGRYELGNFAKNVRNFTVINDAGKKLPVHKISKDRWQAETRDTKTIRVSYMYYANEINAGSSYLGLDQLYVNPVNCCIYTDDTKDDAIQVLLNIPHDWQVASSFGQDGDYYTVENVDELLDTPFICSASLQKRTYESFGVLFHVWFNGEVKPDWDRLLNDFQRFTDCQIAKFSEFPVKEYHFLNQILPYKAYHGVEHTKSTVIALGPSYDIFEDLYTELLGVSSHELYHTWNVKTIRPIEMYPYDFSKENYSKLGYICEGVTTYQGDLFLFKSKVFSVEQYLKELGVQLQRHFDNHGRFNYSVAESSFDTWLDGYQMGAPGRKVSIYTEGCLLALVTDVKIRQATNNKYGLDDAMKRLYFNFALNDKGVSEQDYKEVLEQVSGISFDAFFNDYINGCRPYESIITEAFEYLGLELNHEPSKVYVEGRLGMKVQALGQNFKVAALYPGGPAEVANLALGDEIIAVNGYACKGELNKWFKYFDDDKKIVTIIREGELMELEIPEVNRHFYNKYSVSLVKDPNGPQKAAFKAWSN